MKSSVKDQVSRAIRGKRGKLKRDESMLSGIVLTPPTPLIALSTEAGVLVVVLTAITSPEPTEIRLAIEKPFAKAVSAPAEKCHQSSSPLRDEQVGSERRATVAFIPTPKRARVQDGALYYRAKLGREECFFNVPTQRLESFEKEKREKLLFALNAAFKKVVTASFPADHELVLDVLRLENMRATSDNWRRVQRQVRDKLKQKDFAGALKLLEPLVYSKTPSVAAEKLLGELLYKAKQKSDSDSDAPASVAALVTARLLLEYGLARASQR